VRGKPIQKEEFLPEIISNRKRRSLIAHPYSVGGTAAKPQEFPHMVIYIYIYHIYYIQSQDRYSILLCTVLNI